MKLTDFLNKLFAKAKVDATKSEIAAMLTAAAAIDIDDETAATLDTSLMAEDAAVNNSKIRNKIKAEVLNGVDADLDTELADAGLDETEIAAIKGQKDTIQKTRTALRALKEKAKLAGKAGEGTTHKALNDQVAALNAKLKEQSEKFDSDILALKEKNDVDFVDYQLNTELSSKNYALPEQMSAEMKRETAALQIKKGLAAKGLKIIRNEAGAKLVKLDGTEPYDDKHTLLSLPTFIDGVLANSGLLKTSGGVDPQNQQQQQQQQYGSGKQVQVDPNQQAYAKQMDTQLATLLTGAGV